VASAMPVFRATIPLLRQPIRTSCDMVADVDGT
jgi:hypothetical protein